VIQQGQGAGQDHGADDGGVQQQGDGDPEAHLLEHDQLAAGERLRDIVPDSEAIFDFTIATMLDMLGLTYRRR
jgi:hypothetical protein